MSAGAPEPPAHSAHSAHPAHPASGRLALLALCGELVIAIDAMAVLEIRRVAETTVRVEPGGLIVLEHAGALARGWDLAQLLGLGTSSAAWVITAIPGLARPVGFRVGRCVLVQPLPTCRPIPRGLFTARADTLVAGFSTAGVPELADRVSGVVVDLARVLDDHERAQCAPIGPGAA